MSLRDLNAVWRGGDHPDRDAGQHASQSDLPLQLEVLRQGHGHVRGDQPEAFRHAGEVPMIGVFLRDRVSLAFLPNFETCFGSFVFVWDAASRWWVTWWPSECTRRAADRSCWTSSPTRWRRASTWPASRWSSRASASSRSCARTCRRWWCRCRTAPAASGALWRRRASSVWCRSRTRTRSSSPAANSRSNSACRARWPTSWPRCTRTAPKRRSWPSTRRTTSATIWSPSTSPSPKRASTAWTCTRARSARRPAASRARNTCSLTVVNIWSILPNAIKCNALQFIASLSHPPSATLSCWPGRLLSSSSLCWRAFSSSFPPFLLPNDDTLSSQTALFPLLWTFLCCFQAVRAPSLDLGKRRQREKRNATKNKTKQRTSDSATEDGPDNDYFSISIIIYVGPRCL